MNVEEAVRDSLRTWSEDGLRPPSDLADRVLRARRRRRTGSIALTAVTAAVLAVAVTLPQLHDDGGRPPATTIAQGDVLGHPRQTPPRDLIAAGGTAVSAYSTSKTVDQPNHDQVRTYVWRLYDPGTQRYEKVPWAMLDVAPGMRTAAVLEGELPTRRVGLLDMETGKVDRWFALDHPVAGIRFSPDGKRLLATAYSKNPDRLFHDHMQNVNGKDRPGPVQSRTGFSVVDVASGEERYAELPPESSGGGFGNAREDVDWNRDGSLVWAPSMFVPGRIYHELDGRKVPAPTAEKYVSYPEAGLTPDGRLVAGDFAGHGAKIAASVRDARSGEQVGTVPVQQLLSWADNRRVIGWGCDPCGGRGEFRNRLLLVKLGSDKAIPLSDYRTAGGAGRWEPLFTRR